MSSLYVIYTPYQLLSSINTAEGLQERDYIFLFVHPNMRKYLKACSGKLHGICIDVTDVYDIRNKKDGMGYRFETALDLFRKKKILKKTGIDWERVENLYVPSDESICRIIYKLVKKSRKKIILNLIDDGIGTYIGKIDYKKHFWSILYYSIFLNRKFYENLKNIYCYFPRLVVTDKADINLCEIKMLKISENIFGDYVKNFLKPYMGRKVIFLDQGKDNSYIRSCINALTEVFSKEDILIKKHPRIETDGLYHNLDITNDGIPFEMIVLLCDMKDSLIISDSSTGNITPKLLYDQCPKSIMLFAINDCIDSVYKDIIKFINKINQSNLLEPVYLPKSIDEFRVQILKIKNQLKPIKERK